MVKRNCLTREQKIKLINLSFLPDILEEDFRCLLNSEDRQKLLDARKIIMDVLESNLKTMTLDLMKRFQKELRTIKHTISRKGEPSKPERIVNAWDLETVLEHSMQCCVNCNRNHKECRLNEAFKKLNIPVMDSEQTGCKYRIDVEVKI